MCQKLRPNFPVKLKACIKRQSIVLLCKQTCPIISGPDLFHSVIHRDFLYYFVIVARRLVEESDSGDS